jgi:hypothetical protein
MEEDLVGVIEYHIVSEATVVLHSFSDVGIELAAEIGYAVRQLLGLPGSAACNETIRYISVAPVGHLIKVVGDAEETNDVTVETSQEEVGKNLRDLYSERQALEKAINELIEEAQQLLILDLGAEPFLHEKVKDVLKVMVSIELNEVICALIVQEHVTTEQVDEIMSATTRHTGTTATNESVAQDRLDEIAGSPLDDMVRERELADDASLTVIDDVVAVGGSVP